MPDLSEPFPDEDATAAAATPQADGTAAETAGVVFASIARVAPEAINETRSLSCDSKMARLLDDPRARSVLQRRIPDVVASPQIVMARGITLKQLSRFRQTGITPADLAAIDEDLSSPHRR